MGISALLFYASCREADSEREVIMKENLLLSYLKQVCYGRKNTHKSSHIERALDMSGTELRKMVHRMRKKGIPIASGRDGYFYAANAGELYATIRQLQGMERGLQAVIRGLEGAMESFGAGGEEP